MQRYSLFKTFPLSHRIVLRQRSKKPDLLHPYNPLPYFAQLQHGIHNCPSNTKKQNKATSIRSMVCTSEFGPDTAQCRNRNTQIRSNIVQVYTPANVRIQLQQFFVSLTGREGQPVDACTLQGQQAFLMYHPIPVDYFNIRFIKFVEFLYGYGIGQSLLYCLYIFKASLVVIEAQQSESNISFTEKSGGMLFPVYQAIRACHTFFNEVYVAVYYSGLYKQALPGKVMRGKVLAQSLKGFLGNGVIALHLIVYVLHGVVVGGAHSNNL